MPSIPLTYLLITMYYSRRYLCGIVYYSPFRKYAMCSRCFTMRSEAHRMSDQLPTTVLVGYLPTFSLVLIRQVLYSDTSIIVTREVR